MTLEQQVTILKKWAKEHLEKHFSLDLSKWTSEVTQWGGVFQVKFTKGSRRNPSIIIYNIHLSANGQVVQYGRNFGDLEM